MNPLPNYGLRFPLESIQDSLRVCQKIAQGSSEISSLQRRGFIKDYVHMECVLIVRFYAAGEPGEYDLVFHRVPARIAQLEFCRPLHAAGETGEINTGNCGTKIQSDRMLPISYLGQFPNKVMASGVGIRSAVWLQPAQDIPQLYWDSNLGCLPRLGLGAQFIIKVCGTIGPGEVNGVLGGMADGRTRGINGTVKRVPYVQQRLVCFSGMLCGSFETSTIFKTFWLLSASNSRTSRKLFALKNASQLILSS